MVKCNNCRNNAYICVQINNLTIETILSYIFCYGYTEYYKPLYLCNNCRKETIDYLIDNNYKFSIKKL